MKQEINCMKYVALNKIKIKNKQQVGNMKIQVVKKQKNPVLHREEIDFKIEDAKIVPSRKEVRQQLAALLNAKEDVIIVQNIMHEFGQHLVKGYAKLYENGDFLKQVELQYMVNRNTGQKGQKKEAAPATAGAEAPQQAPPQKGAAKEAAPSATGKVEAKKPEGKAEAKQAAPKA